MKNTRTYFYHCTGIYAGIIYTQHGSYTSDKEYKNLQEFYIDAERHIRLSMKNKAPIPRDFTEAEFSLKAFNPID